MLADKVIVYDDSCPMCKRYTYWFVAWGFLKPENRIGFATASDEILQHVDLDRGRHEIPLFDRSTKTTIYGLEALFFVLGSEWRWLRPTLRLRATYWFFYPAYQIITYNRRVIAGCATSCGFDCAPDLNRFYRTVYLLLAGTVVAAVGAALIATNQTLGLAILLVFTLLGSLVGTLRGIRAGREARWNDAGNGVTALLMVAVLLLPMAIVAALPVWANAALAVTAIMLGIEEAKRRGLVSLARRTR